MSVTSPWNPLQLRWNLTGSSPDLPLVRSSPTQCAVVCCVRSIELLHISMPASLLYQTVHFLSLSDFFDHSVFMSFSHKVNVTLSTFSNPVRRHLYNLKMISSFNWRMLSKDLVIFVCFSVSVVPIWPSYHSYAFPSYVIHWYFHVWHGSLSYFTSPFIRSVCLYLIHCHFSKPMAVASSSHPTHHHYPTVNRGWGVVPSEFRSDPSTVFCERGLVLHIHLEVK